LRHWESGALGDVKLGGIIKYQPTKVSAAAWRTFILAHSLHS
jgi:hypothetical protein